jgi:hypothetical protein
LQEAVLSQYHYNAKKKNYEKNQAVLQAAHDFCEREENGFYEYDDKDGNEGKDAEEQENEELVEEEKKV